MRLSTAVLCLLLFALPAVGAKQAVLAGAAGESETFTIAGLIALLDKSDIPDTLARMDDLNPDDAYASGLDVLSGLQLVRVGGVEIPATVELYIREGKVGGLKVLQTPESHSKTSNTQALYETARDELEAAGLTPDKRDYFAEGTSNWTVGKKLQVTISRGYGTQGMYFYIADAATQPLNSKFFVTKREAEERERAASGGGFWFY